jgi:hypothetical protein
MTAINTSASDILAQMGFGAKLYRGFGNQIELLLVDGTVGLVPHSLFDRLIDEHKIVPESGDQIGFYRLA